MKLVDSKIFKSILAKIPLIALLLMTISTNYYYFFNDSYSKYYTLISYFSGFSILSLPAYFYIVYKFNFCTYSKVALWGVCFYVFFNMINFFIELSDNTYANVFESGVVSTTLFSSFWHLIKDINKLIMENIITGIKLSLYGIFAYLGISMEAFGILMILMCLDSFVGAIKAIRMKVTFSFNKLIWGFVLKLCFLIIPLVVALLGKSLGYDFAIAVNIVISVLSVSEGYSILGNIYSAKNKIEVKKVDAVSLLLSTLRKALMSIMKRSINKISNAGDCEIK